MKFFGGTYSSPAKITSSLQGTDLRISGLEQPGLEEPEQAHVAQDKGLEPVFYPTSSDLFIQPWAPVFVDLEKLEKQKEERRAEKKGKIACGILLTLFTIVLALSPWISEVEIWPSTAFTNEIAEIEAVSNSSGLYTSHDYKGEQKKLVPRDIEGLSDVEAIPSLDRCETSDECEANDYCFEGFCFESTQSNIEESAEATGSKRGKKRKPKKKPSKETNFPPPEGCQLWSQPCKENSECCSLKCKKRGPEPSVCEPWQSWAPCKKNEDCWSGHCERRYGWIWRWKVCHPK